MTTDAYAAFLARKLRTDPRTGLAVVPPLPEALFAFQRDIVRWALKRGRAAVFAQTGLGKSFIELAWGQAVHTTTGGNVLLLTPLAVAGQMVREARKFGLPAKQCATQADVVPGVTVTNYEKLRHFDLSTFVGVILDESSILKSFDGKTRTALIEACANVPYRLCATATPAPNDFTELGNHAEFLGVMSVTGMQATFFTHDAGDTTAKWRLKGHAEEAFWQWMCSWAVLLRRPSDLGYPDGGYDLAPLNQIEHVVPVEGEAAASLAERLTARRNSIDQRVAKALEIVYGEEGIPAPVARGESGEGQGVPSQDEGRAQCPSPGALCAGGTPADRSAEAGAAVAGQQSGEAQGAAAEALWDQSGGVPFDDEGAEQRLRDLPADGHGRCEQIPAGRSLPQDAEGSRPALHAVQPSAGEVQRRPDAATQGGRVPGSITKPWVIWCNLNDEQDALEAVFGADCISIYGSLKDDEKEARLKRWLAGEAPVLLSKPRILGFGLNFQRCADTVFVGLNDSFEQVYQAVRRFWRFGQTRPVTAHFIAASTEGAVLANLRRKEAEAERMGAAMVAQMADLSSELVNGQARQHETYSPTIPVALPRWLREEAA